MKRFVIRTIDEAITWLRDVAEADPEHPRSPFYKEAAQDLADRRPANRKSAYKPGKLPPMGST